MTAKVLTPDFIETRGYTKAELRWMLSRHRGQKVPPRTLDHWIAVLAEHGWSLQPNEAGLYGEDDLQLLTRLVLWLKRKRSIAQFAYLITQEIENNGG